MTSFLDNVMRLHHNDIINHGDVVDRLRRHMRAFYRRKNGEREFR